MGVVKPSFLELPGNAVVQIAPALAAGCAIVIKPSSGTVLDGYVLAKLR
ncbi:MAG: aldehyde dehydrogenase family protein [Porticoccaceae bacterium]